MAEIIVAKHRNGAVDTIKLRFRKEQAKFMDYDDLSGEGYSAMDSSMNTEFGSAIGGGAGSLDKINDFGGYGEFGIPSGSGSGPGGLGGTFGAAPPGRRGLAVLIFLARFRRVDGKPAMKAGVRAERETQPAADSIPTALPDLSRLERLVPVVSAQRQAVETARYRSTNRSERSPEKNRMHCGKIVRCVY